MENELFEIRNEIDKIDKAIIKLFLERMNIVEKVAEIKYKNNKEILDSKREEMLLAKAASGLDEPEKSQVTELMTLIMKLSKEHQSDFINSKN
ncbi:MAG: chorismate mutase [Oscillospiraceae bacterium]